MVLMATVLPLGLVGATFTTHSMAPYLHRSTQARHAANASARRRRHTRSLQHAADGAAAEACGRAAGVVAAKEAVRRPPGGLTSRLAGPARGTWWAGRSPGAPGCAAPARSATPCAPAPRWWAQAHTPVSETLHAGTSWATRPHQATRLLLAPQALKRPAARSPGQRTGRGTGHAARRRRRPSLHCVPPGGFSGRPRAATPARATHVVRAEARAEVERQQAGVPVVGHKEASLPVRLPRHALVPAHTQRECRRTSAHVSLVNDNHGEGSAAQQDNGGRWLKRWQAHLYPPTLSTSVASMAAMLSSEKRKRLSA